MTGKYKSLMLLVAFSLNFSCKSSRHNQDRNLKGNLQDQAGRQHQDHKQNGEKIKGSPYGEKSNADQILH